MTTNQTTPERREMYSDNAFKLGFFCPNASNGRQMTQVPERWSGSWADNHRLALMSDDAGLEFLLPIARWKGYGGAIDHQGATFETLTWATALLALTKRITVFATVHVPLVNPVAAAKALVTADHVSGGRIGLNIVVGWNETEFLMFGVAQRPVQERYPYGQEWIDVVKRIWNEREFDFDGTFLHMKGVSGDPKLVRGATQPLLMNAGRSAEGQAYAIRNCDALFTDTSQVSLEEAVATIRSFKDRARAQGRELGVYADGLVICRRTKREAEEYRHYALVENIDWSAIDERLANKGMTRANTPAAKFEAARNHYASGSRSYIGDPDTIAAEFAELSRIGLNGLAMNFINYIDEFPLFRDEVLPRMERLGLRAPQKASVAV
jgi:alkanesulfonate monooxygenase SsuD/methylene tetrahydromethanopterin reductase-like flavin-dependent oxidoreductase (luciferase family)